MATIGLNFAPSTPPNKYRFSGVSSASIVEFIIPNTTLIELNSMSNELVLPHFNSLIHANAVHVKPTAKAFIDSLIKRAASVRGKYRQTHGQKKSMILKESTKMYALLDEVYTYGALQKQVTAQQDRIQELAFKLNEVTEKSEKFESELKGKSTELERAEHAARVLINQNEKFKKFAKRVSKPVNRGRMVGDLGSRQQTRKLSVLKSPIESAVKFAEGFGLKLNKVVFEDQYGKMHEVDYALKRSCNYDSLPEAEQVRVQSVLHIMDKFGISDEGYHRLTMASEAEMDKSYIIKQCKKKIDSFCAVSRTPGPSVGAQLDFYSEIDRMIEDSEIDNGELFKVRLSGDGTKISKSANFLNFSMGPLESTGSLPAASSEEGNRTLAVVQVSESYDNIKTSLGDIIHDVNEIQAKRDDNNIVKYTTSSGKSVRLQFSLSGDMKFLLLVLGMNAANSKYACIYCKVPKTERWITSRCRNFYYMIKLRRTSQQMKDTARKKPKEDFGVLETPLFDIPLEFCVLDELHLLLRITDNLTRNIILEAEQIERKQRGMNKVAVRQCELFFQSCGISFKIWTNKSNGKLDYTSLSGNEKKKLLQHLPNKMLAGPLPFMNESTRIQVANLWAGFATIYFNYIGTPVVTEQTCSTLFSIGCQWIQDFIAVGSKREGYSKSDITPYMHSMVYHMPYLMSFHSGIKAFTGQGLEKVNDDLKLIYFKRVNKAMATEQTLRVRFRKSWTRKYRPVKRAYTKRNVNHWANLKRGKSKFNV